MAATWNRAGHYIFILWFLLSIFYLLSFFFSSLILSRRRLDVYHTSTHGVTLVRYIYNFAGSCPLTEFCMMQNSPYVQVLSSPILAALLHGTPAASVSQTLRRVQGMESRNFRIGRHLYSAVRPSRWASAHILVSTIIKIILYT